MCLLLKMLGFIKQWRTASSNTKSLPAKDFIITAFKKCDVLNRYRLSTRENKNEINCGNQYKKKRREHVICSVKKKDSVQHGKPHGILCLLHHNQRMVQGHLIKL